MLTIFNDTSGVLIARTIGQNWMKKCIIHHLIIHPILWMDQGKYVSNWSSHCLYRCIQWLLKRFLQQFGLGQTSIDEPFWDFTSPWAVTFPRFHLITFLVTMVTGAYNYLKTKVVLLGTTKSRWLLRDTWTSRSVTFITLWTKRNTGSWDLVPC